MKILFLIVVNMANAKNLNLKLHQNE